MVTQRVNGMGKKALVTWVRFVGIVAVVVRAVVTGHDRAAAVVDSCCTVDTAGTVDIRGSVVVQAWGLVEEGG